MRILVSACLLGCACRYDGMSKACPKVMALAKEHELVPVCPEQLGGLPTPRIPAEITGERVLRRDGGDVTDAYEKGAREAARLYELTGCRLAILKDRSPSCGSGLIYDGTFTGRLTPGDGKTARLFREKGFPVIGEEELIQKGLPEI